MSEESYPEGPWDDLPSPKDLKIHLGTVTYFLHSNVVASSFPYFTRLLRISGRGDSKPNAKLDDKLGVINISLNDLPGGPESFEIVARYAYKHSFCISEDNVMPVLASVCYLEMNFSFIGGNMSLFGICKTFIKERLLCSWQNCLKFVTFFHSLKFLVQMDDLLCICENILSNHAKYLNFSMNCTVVDEAQKFCLEALKCPEGVVRILLIWFEKANLSFVSTCNIIAHQLQNTKESSDEKTENVNTSSEIESPQFESVSQKSIELLLEYLLNQVVKSMEGDMLNDIPVPSLNYLLSLMNLCVKYCSSRSSCSAMVSTISKVLLKSYGEGSSYIEKLQQKQMEMDELKAKNTRLMRYIACMEDRKIHNSKVLVLENSLERQKSQKFEIMAQNRELKARLPGGKEVLHLQKTCISSFQAHTSPIYALCVQEDGIVWTAGYFDCLIKGWRNTQCISVLRGHSSVIRVIVAQSTGMIYSGSNDETIKCWFKGSCVATLHGHSNYVSSLVLSEKDELWSGSGDGSIKMWVDQSCQMTLKGHKSHISALAISPNGCLVSGGGDNMLMLWFQGVCLSRIKTDFQVLKLSFVSNRCRSIYLYGCDKKFVGKFPRSKYELLRWDLSDLFFEPVIQNSTTDENSSDEGQLDDQLCFSPISTASFTSTSSTSSFSSYLPLSASSSFSLSTPSKPQRLPPLSNPSLWFTSQTVIAQRLHCSIYQDPFVIQDECTWLIRNDQIVAMKDDKYVSSLKGHDCPIYCLAAGNDDSIYSGDVGGFIKHWKA